MRVRNRKLVPFKTFCVTMLCLLPLTYGYYIYNQVQSLYDELLEFQYNCPPDPTTFLPGNYTRLDEMAWVYDDLFSRNHLPLNFTAECYYTDSSYSEVDWYSYSDNGALWTGVAMAAWVFHYVAAVREGNTTDAGYALEVIQRMINGFSMLMIVPNGGLGPEYGGILARGWAGPGDQDIAPMYFEENSRHFNGTGDYSNYRWRGYTSNDEYGGYYMGLALALKYIPDEYVQTTVHLIVDQLASYMLETNFLGINGPGGPTGVNQKAKFFGGAVWVAILLKMASMCYPEKYEALYYQFITAEAYYWSTHEGGDQETLANYYAFNFAHCVIFGFLLLEGTTSPIGKVFYESYLKGFRAITKYHRNAWFNVIYLALRIENGKTAVPKVQKDIEDQLMRMEINHFPDRNYGILPPPANASIWNVTEIWNNFMDTHPWGTTYSVPFLEFNVDQVVYTYPLTVEYQEGCIFHWEHNPFRYDGAWVDPLYENSGLTFMVPYWIARAYGFIPETGMAV